jgi:hypothetical protein
VGVILSFAMSETRATVKTSKMHQSGLRAAETPCFQGKKWHFGREPKTALFV